MFLPSSSSFGRYLKRGYTLSAVRAMPGIRLKSTTLRALNSIKGFVMSQEGKSLSHDDVINILMMQAKFSPNDFPDWPMFKMTRREMEKAMKDYNELLRTAFDSEASRRSPSAASSKPRSPRG
jgi:hypothetical protein